MPPKGSDRNLDFVCSGSTILYAIWDVAPIRETRDVETICTCTCSFVFRLLSPNNVTVTSVPRRVVPHKNTVLNLVQIIWLYLQKSLFCGNHLGDQQSVLFRGRRFRRRHGLLGWWKYRPAPARQYFGFFCNRIHADIAGSSNKKCRVTLLAMSALNLLMLSCPVFSVTRTCSITSTTMLWSWTWSRNPTTPSEVWDVLHFQLPKLWQGVCVIISGIHGRWQACQCTL